MRPRRGHLLAEALCALALAGVLMAAAGAALGNARRSLGSMERMARSRQASREAASVSAVLLREADSLVVHDDTTVSAAILVALSAACAVEPTRRAILLPPATLLHGIPLTTRAQPLEAGDIVTLLAVDSIARVSWWVSTVIDSVGERTGVTPCGVAEGWLHPLDAGAARIRLSLRDSLPDDVRVGAPVRVTRRGRFALYHAGSGDWMLGWRHCAPDGAACGAAQPVAGPLLTPATGGLRFALVGARGLLVRARAESASPGDSLLVALHGGAP